MQFINIGDYSAVIFGARNGSYLSVKNYSPPKIGLSCEEKVASSLAECYLKSRGGGGTRVYFGWVCAARVSKFGPRFRKNLHSK